MRYSAIGATSIDLFVSEMTVHSRHLVEVIAEVGGTPLPAHRVHELPAFSFANTWRRARVIGALEPIIKPAAFVMQQHLPSAAAVRWRTSAPVILQKHNFVRPPRPQKSFGHLSERRNLAQYNALQGLTFVSEVVRTEFERHWPQVTAPRCIIHNGADFSAWTPHDERENIILVVGRASPDKGLVEAANGLCAVLPRYSGWSTIFVVSERGRDPAYFEKLRAALAPLGPQAKIAVNLPFAQVKALNETAAIALIPSLWREPFGRTALEGHAGGAAVISSGSGGLREVSGDGAIYLPSLDARDIAECVNAVIADEPMRRGLAGRGAERVRRLFDLRTVASALDDFCDDVIAHAGGG